MVYNAPSSAPLFPDLAGTARRAAGPTSAPVGPSPDAGGVRAVYYRSLPLDLGTLRWMLRWRRSLLI